MVAEYYCNSLNVSQAPYTASVDHVKFAPMQLNRVVSPLKPS
jgi:hypothetical protein